MRNGLRRGAAFLLAASLVFSNMTIAGAEETSEAPTEVLASETEAQTTEAPATEAATEAPATEAPTEAPATEAPATEAPTEAPATEAPATEAPTEAPATEAPTEAPATETPTEAPATETATEKETEKASETAAETKKELETEESGVYTVEEKQYTVTVELPEDLELPKGAELVVTSLKDEEERAGEILELVEEAAQDKTVQDWELYDIHFEKDGKETEIAQRDKADITVTITWTSAAFQSETVTEQSFAVYHIRDLTSGEIEEAREAALQELTEEEQEQGAEPEYASEKAEKLKSELTDAKSGGLSEVTFRTDGCSEFFLGVLETTEEQPETEAQTEAETSSETKAETETETSSETEAEAETETFSETEAETETETSSETEAETETETSSETEAEAETETSSGTEAETETEVQTETEAQTEASSETGSESETEDQGAEITPLSSDGDAGSLILNMKETGGSGESTVLTLSASRALTAEEQSSVTVKAGTEEMTLTWAQDGKSFTVPVTLSTKTVALTVAGLPVADSSAAGIKTPVTYTVDAGGNYLGTTPKLSASYYTVYQQTAPTSGTAAMQPLEIQLTETAVTTVTTTDIYSKLELTASGSESGSGTFSGMRYTLTAKGESSALSAAATTTSDGVAYLGLPAGTYTVTPDGSSTPTTYIAAAKSETVTISDQAYQQKCSFTYDPMTLTLTATDKRRGTALAGVTFTVKKSGDSDSKKLTADANGQTVLTGYLERGTVYEIKQTRKTGYFSATASGLDSGTLTVSAAGQNYEVAFSSQPSVVNLSVIDGVSDTSPYKGDYISGATLRVDKVGSDGTLTEVTKVTTTEGVTTLVGVLDPGSKYRVTQTSAPAGYLVSTTAKQFKLNKERTIQLSDDTVKVYVTRKGYDSRTKKSDGKYEYTNLKVLAGAVLEIRDTSGNIIKDKNGNALRWTSESSGGHLIEGVLASGTKYLLVETTAPEAYESAGQGAFTTYTSGNQAAVTMQTRRGSGTITVALRASYQGNAIKVSGTYYCALFRDAAYTQRYTDAGVKALTMTTGKVYATAVFENVPAGVWYVAETDSSGNAISSTSTYTVSISIGKLNLSAGGSLLAELTNKYTQAPSGYQTVSSSELKSSYSREYANYGGSASSAETLAEGGSSTVQTGDTTQILPWIIALAAALIVIVVIFVIKRKNRK